MNNLKEFNEIFHQDDPYSEENWDESNNDEKLLLDFINWWISHNKRRDVKHSLKEIVNEFLLKKRT